MSKEWSYMKKKYDVFISYSSKDIGKARLLKSALDGRGFGSFFAEESLQLGVMFVDEIEQAISNSSVFLYLYTSHSTDSIWMKKELAYAEDKNKPIIPVVFSDDKVMDAATKFMLADRNISEISFGKDFGLSIRNLIQQLNSVLSKINESKILPGKGVVVSSDRSCKVYRLEEIGIAYEGVSNIIQVPEGNHKLMFVDLEKESVRVEKNVEIDGDPQEIDVKLLEKYKKSVNSDEIDVFISYNSDDLDYAKEIAEMCRYAGKSYFLSAENLKKMGESAYVEAIAEALDKSRHLVVVCMDVESLKSKWVKLEYTTFINEIYSGRKGGNMITIVNDGISVNDLPIWLRGHEVIPYKQKENAVEYFK